MRLQCYDVIWAYNQPVIGLFLIFFMMFCFYERRHASGLLGTITFGGYFGSVSFCKSTICRKLKGTNETVAHERPQTRAQSMENSDNQFYRWRRKGTWERKENLNNTSRKNKVAFVVFVHNCKQDIYMCTLYLFTPLLMCTKRHPITVLRLC